MAAPIVIVGAGQAGLQIAESLRGGKYEGEILLIGDEPVPPYHRPPLSKDVLLGLALGEQIEIRSRETLARKNITLLTGVPVQAINRERRQIAMADGTRYDYRGLALATGARLRRLTVPGSELQGVVGLRSLADSHVILAALKTARHVAVVGGGFIGLEVAAAARKAGAQVTVFEAGDRLMARAVAPVLSDFFLALHEAQGVEVRLGRTVMEIVGKEGRVTGLYGDDGGFRRADLVVVGIGIEANDRLAAAAGLDCDRGIVVDACSRTSDPLIVAAGDCTVLRDAVHGGMRRLESVQNAVEQGKSAAAALLGQERPFSQTPWFWSTQYDVTLQMAGLSTGYDSLVLRGNPATGAFSVFYYRQDRLIAVESVNRPQDHMLARKLLDAGQSPSPEVVADEGSKLALA
ncbi:NAD(P)/FAD-dependent oxidoreductase [Telmatospirillum sp. J64-1]|uniref:NAD(P)/FAD-dependent oxidoreductase n=1 Tax=Telmatospirillum sp. J64-1 TaxID=2502183 RepID=UPI00115F5477|nr:FAD-dependent oxidoreductase [Telmatospirillum sp. J64-1]